jgi:GH43 family beta-xylosidase
VLVRNGRVFMTYSASATGAEYCIGLLTADENADLLDPRRGTKSPRPVFTTWSGNGVFGPGHNSFTTTPDGKTDIIVYHARSYRDIEGHELDNPDRHTRAQPISWRAGRHARLRRPGSRRARQRSHDPARHALTRRPDAIRCIMPPLKVERSARRA